MSATSLTDRSLNHIWNPLSQMKDYEQLPLLSVESANGSFIMLNNKKQLIDAISSWWCKSLGHNHPRLKAALFKQANAFEHVIFANTTNQTIVQLSEKLCSLNPALTKIMYASDGASAVEIALKMSLHTRIIRGEQQKNKFISLKHSYHGDTIGALSVSDLGIYKSAYQSLLFNVEHITDIPYVNDTSDHQWNDCSNSWFKVEKHLAEHADTTTALIVEPIVQGAAGMKIYSQDFLRRLRVWTQQHNIHLIADEIMTGLGRTGKMLACDHAEINPDFICLGKALTAGWLPMSATLMTDEIYATFYADYAANKSFLHSHTFSGNPLAASIALEALNIIDEEKLYQRANTLGKLMHDAMNDIARTTQKITHVRSIGAIVAADIIGDDPNRRYGLEVFKQALELGAFLRPLGNTIYWLLPLNTEFSVVDQLKEITQKAIMRI